VDDRRLQRRGRLHGRHLIPRPRQENTHARSADRRLDRRIERFSGRKVNRALRLLKAIARAVPDILDKRAAFIRAYEATNYVELDRAQAMLRYGGKIALRDQLGNLVLDGDGRPMLHESPIAAMTEDDWAAAGQKLRMPTSPTQAEQAWAIFPDVFDRAEDLVLKLLALVLMSNAEVKQLSRAGTDHLDTALEAQAEDLLDDSYGDQLLELAAAAGEVVDDQIISKARELQEAAAWETWRGSSG
jgi:hypothetical protein